ncbi:MAG: hypothetical protein PHC34_04840 [Candidatus Gastranaerophilales bacterium]|nr:hypothetical protein [Candidatus Gastranaerophilales bacterium]
MSISGIEANNAINTLNLQGSIKSGTVQKVALNEIADSFLESDETLEFKEIVGKYDIKNMSRNEANKMYKELIDNKLIDLKDMLVTFDPTRISGWQDGVSSISGWKVSSNPDQKMNFLEGLKSQAEYNKKYGNSEFQSRFDEALELAEKINHFQS